MTLKSDENLQRVRQLEAEAQQLVYSLSHDLREPIRMVTSFLDLLSKRYLQQLGADAREYIYYAVDGASRAEAMLDGLLQLSHVMTDVQKPAAIAAEQFVRDIAGGLAVAQDQTDAKIRIDHLPIVTVDAGQWRQLWKHLLDNAFKFRAPERALVVQITAEDAGQYWRFICQDNGIGVDPNQTERIFNPFQRLHSAEEYAGIGMGLPVSRRIVERHGGQMDCDASISEGSLFWFTVPKSL